MTSKEIFEFIKDNPVFFLGTCEGNEPRVRAMRIYQADENGIIFNTSTGKELYKQLQKNDSVELCFRNELDKIQLRIRGRVELIEDEEFKKTMAQQVPALEGFITNDAEPELVIYRLKKAAAKIWKMEEDFTPRIMGNFQMTSVWFALYKGGKG